MDSNIPRNINHDLVDKYDELICQLPHETIDRIVKWMGKQITSPTDMFMLEYSRFNEFKDWIEIFESKYMNNFVTILKYNFPDVNLPSGKWDDYALQIVDIHLGLGEIYSKYTKLRKNEDS